MSRLAANEAAGAVKDAEESAQAAKPAVKEVGDAESHTFKAETRQLLDIVANALYTDRHIFVRELISNCSDALEKLRHRQAAGEAVSDTTEELGISIETDEATGTITITDTGIGMSKEELVDNIGTIAHSGSKAFLQKAQEDGLAGSELGHSLIGQFGVGFYSAFMVADEIEVMSRSADPDNAQGHVWRSKGDGAYSIRKAEGLPRGTSIRLRLKPDAREFSKASSVEDIIKRYSNFVGFPIQLNGEQVNTVSAIWAEPKHLVSEEQYQAFYKYKSGQEYAEAMMKLHFATDAPLELQALFFVPERSEEGHGLGRSRAGVDLYSRKVLIEAESRVMPDWLRFLKGVVDSGDIPLNISREGMQDTALMLRIKSVLTRRVLRFFEAEMRRDRKLFERFFSEFGPYLKEGVCTDAAYQPDIGRLLLFESSALKPGQLTTLDEYVARCPPGQDRIYYLVSPHRGLAEGSPYLEAFRGAGPGGSDVEVLFAYSSLDDFVFQQLGQHNGRQVVTAEAADLGLSKQSHDDGASVEASSSSSSEEGRQDGSGGRQRLSGEQVKELGAWLSEVALNGKVKEVRASTRLRSTPAVVVDHESASVRRMMRIFDEGRRDSEAPTAADHVLPRQTLEVNPAHPVIVALHAQRQAQPQVAKAVAEQVFDNALVAAGLLDDARSMLPRLNALLSAVMDTAAASGGAIKLGEDHAGAKKRFVPADEQAFTDARNDLEQALQDELLRKASEGGPVEGGVGANGDDGRTVEVEEPEVLRVGPDGRLTSDMAERR